jgi:hypothetical protein
MASVMIRHMVHYDLAGMTGEIAAVFGMKLYELSDAQRSKIDKIGYKYAGRAVKIVQDHL